MASAKDTPRQKMIGMMYLVLTALLALNVSKDILDAFIVVNKGLENTNMNFTDRNENLYAQFDLAKSIDPILVTPNWKKAQEIKKQSTELSNYIDKLQKQLVAKTEGIEQSVADTLQMASINSKDNYDTPTNILIGESEDGSAGASRELKNKLMAFRNQLNGYILTADKTKVKVDINTDDPKNSENNENWEMYNFYHRPLVASMTILSKLKSDVKNAESLVVDYLLKQNDTEAIKFDTIAAKVIPQSNYVMLGEEYKSEIFIAAFSKTKKPEMLVGNYNETTKTFDGTPNSLMVEKGLGKYMAKADREGIFTYSGTIKLKSAQNKEVVFPFKSEYIVARPALTVSADKMNVVYLGLDNPISVSVPGIPNERLSVSATNASLRPDGNGKFTMKVSKGPEVNVNVFATMENGERRNMGTMSFRVKEIPKPLSRFGSLTASGKMTKNQIESQMGLMAFYDNFDFKADAKVTSFNMSVSIGGVSNDIPSPNNLITDKMKEQIRLLRKGQKVIFEQIIGRGPDGKEKKLNDLVITVM
jgi:gliding motility-associated protein GldM